MNPLVNSTLTRPYNPNTNRNALSDLKRLLTSRDIAAQHKACTYLIEVIRRYKKDSLERIHMVEYLIENDLTLFLCEATTNLDFTLFRSIVSCFRLLWCNRRFFTEEHAPHVLTAVQRATAHYANTGLFVAVDCCLQFLCELLDCIKSFEAPPPLSSQSAYSADQLLTCLNNLAAKISNRNSSILSSAFVLQSLLSYHPSSMNVRGCTGIILNDVLKQWFQLLVGTLKHMSLVGDNDKYAGMLYSVLCQLCIDALILSKILREAKAPDDFIQIILIDDEERNALIESGEGIKKSVEDVLTEMVDFTKENLKQLPSDVYGVFLKLTLTYLTDGPVEQSVEFCDLLYGRGYLKLLPEVQIIRNSIPIRKLSTLVLGEVLKVLAHKYLEVESSDGNCAKDIHLGLTELQYGIERPHHMGHQLQQFQTYSLLIYAYFYCQSTDNPQEATAPLLPYLVEHILRLPRGFTPPKYIVKALWLVFAMSTISNESLNTFDERIYLEKATERFVNYLRTNCTSLYTHNPAILLWAFTSNRINVAVKIDIMSLWLNVEDGLPQELSTEPAVWDVLLKVLIQKQDEKLLVNSLNSLNTCLGYGNEEDRQEFAVVLWSMLPNVLSKVLIDCDFRAATNICFVLELSANLVPLEINDLLALKIAVLLSTIFSKGQSELSDGKHHFQYACLKLCLYLLGLAHKKNDTRVLLTYTNRAGFLLNVLHCTSSVDTRVACVSLQLLSYVVHYFTTSRLTPKSVIEVNTAHIVKSFKEDSTSEQSTYLLQLVYMILNSGASTPLVLSDRLSSVAPDRQYAALRAVLFRVQMLCCKESISQSSAGWKTLSSIYKYAILSKKDSELVATLTLQPWTHILIQFQVKQGVTEEFLNFINSWLTIYRIAMKNNQGGKKQFVVYKESMIVKTAFCLKNNVELYGNDAMEEIKKKVLEIVDDILEDSQPSFSQKMFISQKMLSG